MCLVAGVSRPSPIHELDSEVVDQLWNYRENVQVS